MQKWVHSALLSSVSLGASMLVPSAIAQPADATAPKASSDVEVIVVTATRREERLVDVPLAVSSLSGSELTSQGLTQVQDYAAKVPGFSLNTEGRLGTRLILRGQNTGGSGASVATMIDDVVLNTATANSLGYTVTANFETFDLARIEVLRGPQGTLYGATAQGGLLKYVTTKPSLTKQEGKFEAGLESVSDGETGWSGKAVYNLPLIEDKLAVRVLGYYKDVPGFIDNSLLKKNDVNGGDQYGGRVAVLFRANDQLQLRFTAQSQQQAYGAEGYAEVKGARGAGLETSDSFQLVGSAPDSRKRFDEKNKSSYTFYNGVIDYDFGSAKLTSSTSYVRAKSSYFNDITDLGLAFFGTSIIDQQNNHNKFNQEFRLASQGGNGPAWQIGSFYSDEDITFNQKIDSRDPADFSKPGAFGVLADSTSPMTYKELSGFGDVTFKVIPRTYLSVGGRYTTNRQTFTYNYQPTLFSGFAGGSIKSADSKESKFTFAVAPRFEVSNEISIYGRVASGYRPGGPIPKFSPAITYARDTFDADTTLNYEVGIKGSTPDQKFGFDLAIYRIDWDKIQIVTGYIDPVTNVTYTAIGNGGKARSSGVEWALTYLPVKNLTLGMTGAYTDAKLTEDAISLNGFKGDALPYVPKVSNALFADYSVSLQSKLRLNIGVTWTDVGERYGNFTTAPGASSHPKIPGYKTLDLRAGLSWDKLRLDLGMRNMTNELGITNYSNNTGYLGASGQANIIQPRTITLRLSNSF